MKYLKYVLITICIFAINACKSDDTVIQEVLDTDGDGITDDLETMSGTDPNNACDPSQLAGYTGFDSTNTTWAVADCDLDGILNGDEIMNATDPYTDDTVYAIPELLPSLSELLIFKGNLADLEFNSSVHTYDLSTPLFTDYSQKLRSIALPKGGKLVYNGEGLLQFPENTIITKTFYYYNDERDASLGKKIIETRILLKKNGTWQTGNYFWNDEQTEALLDDAAHFVPIQWVDITGTSKSINYAVPNNQTCIQCHDNSGAIQPIGPKARAMNFTSNGINSLQVFLDKNILEGVSDVSTIAQLPDWSDENNTMDQRARAYLDVNCAHCHQPGGTYNVMNGDMFDFRFETSLEDSNILLIKQDIQDRINNQISGFFMPYVGTTVIHQEGVDLLNAYIDSL